MALETCPKDLHHLRECLLCSLVKTIDQFEYDGFIPSDEGESRDVCVKLFCLCLHGDSPDESRGQLGGQVVENQYVCCHGLSCWTMTFFQTSP
ncbi:unnamed protein product [Oncorhynchus mykiss]|uniref:Uncharacterized protein n=1 Tax=Oncorhynchus mykiss TaxID=8022 RepID=A0A060YJQ8_ONCMY|nr:unnamed protein product [Oncorhynchus mykiss]